MSRYTDYDAIDYKNYNMIGESQEFMRGVVYMAERIEEAPSIDICFCKECVKHKTHRCHMAFDLIATEDNDFCSYGSRSEKPNNSKVSEKPTGSERSSK